MGQDSQLPKVNPEDTARIDRRKSLLTQIEAALLADQLAVDDLSRATGTDPYNSGGSGKVPADKSVWNGKRVR